MATLYRLTFSANNYTESPSLETLQRIRETQGGVIQELELIVQILRNGELLETCTTPDDADSILEGYRSRAVQAISEEFYTSPIKTVVDPQPDGLND